MKPIKSGIFSKPTHASTNELAIAEGKRFDVTQKLMLLNQVNEEAFAAYIRHCMNAGEPMPTLLAEKIAGTFPVLCSMTGSINKEVQAIVLKAVDFRYEKPFVIEGALHALARARL